MKTSSRKALRWGLWAALKMPAKVFLTPSCVKYLSGGEKADIWIKNCWALSVFETEDLAANKVNRSAAYLFGWVSRANKSLVQETHWLLREEWGWENIFMLRMLSQVLFPFADYSQTAFFFICVQGSPASQCQQFALEGPLFDEILEQGASQ